MIFMEPCVADATRVRMFAQMSTDIRELMPYLNTVIKNATYNKEADTLCFTKEFRLITLYPERVAMAKALSATDAWQVLDWIKDTINQTYENRGFIQPNYQRHVAMTALDVFGLLPGLNCGKCGEPTCLAFAVKFLLDEGRIEQCKPLFTAEYKKLKTIALDFVSALGYEIPESHRSMQHQK